MAYLTPVSRNKQPDVEFTSTACPCCQQLRVFDSEEAFSAYEKWNTMFCIVIRPALAFLFKKTFSISSLAVSKLAYRHSWWQNSYSSFKTLRWSFLSKAVRWSKFLQAHFNLPAPLRSWAWHATIWVHMCWCAVCERVSGWMMTVELLTWC